MLKFSQWCFHWLLMSSSGLDLKLNLLNQMLMGGWFTADFNLINELVEMIIFMLSFM